MHRPLDIGIIGAGVAGLAAATLLTRAGHRVVLHERFETSRPLGSGLMLQPTGLAALDRLGLRAQLEAMGARIGRLHGITDRGATIFDLAYADLAPDSYAIGIHRAALHGALWQAFAHSGASLETGRPIVDIETQAGGHSALRDEQGRSGPGFNLVIDASGARSQFRRLVSPATSRDFSYGAVWAAVPDIGIADGRLAQRYVSARIMIGYLPVGRAVAGGPLLAALFWSLKPGDYPQWREGFENWRSQIVDLWPELTPVVAGLQGPDDLTRATYVHYTARKPFKGALALIGDSAHATSPQLGQGANNGLLDALALTDALASCADIPSALAQYARKRRAHVRFYQMASQLLTPFFQSDSGTLALLRDLCFDRAARIPYLRGQMLHTLAGLKTGIFTQASPSQLAGDAARDFGQTSDAAI